MIVPTPAVLKDLAPSGTLRAAINLGNSVLAQTDAASGKPKGITVDLATELAKRLGVPLSMTTYDGAGKVFADLKDQRWDIAFLAIEPARAAEIEFTSPYVLIEGVYIVPQDSPLRALEEIDRPGIRISTAKGSAYDLFLSRTLKHATLVQSGTGAESMERFRAGGIDVCSGVRQPIMAFLKSHPEYRVIEPRFFEIRQAMGTPKGRHDGAMYLEDFIQEMKTTGFVASGLARSGQPDAVVAP